MEENKHVFIIAEAGVNHNGSIKLAQELVDIAREAGADAVKFQTFQASKIASRYAPKAEYQTHLTKANESQLDMLKKLELNERQHKKLHAYCHKVGIEFMSSPFDTESVDLLVNVLNIARLKIPSGEITNAPLLLKAARASRPVILSTGMSTLGEVEMALAILAFGYTVPEQNPSISLFKQAYSTSQGQKALRANAALLHCTSDYPASFADVNLKAMDTLKQAFGLPVGYSDHTPGIAVPLAAAARGASIIEKHFTIDCSLPGPDHRASLEPAELQQMVSAVRQIELAIGCPAKIITNAEARNLPVVRKSLVAVKKIKKGAKFTEDNLGIKRPGTGLSPVCYWEWLGKKAEKDYGEDELL